jgi:hypothetical protein
MKARVEAASDIAMIGAWDATRSDSLLHLKWGRELDAVLDHDSAAGDIFVLDMASDGGGQIDVYVDEELRDSDRKGLRQVGEEFLISVPSGRLVVAGVEGYRTGESNMPTESSIVTLPAGDYGLRCHVAESEIEPNHPSHDEMEKIVGQEDYSYYRAFERRGCLGYLTLLLFPILTITSGWKIAVTVTLPIFLGYFAIEAWREKRDTRYKLIRKKVNDAWMNAQKQEPPAFIFELRRVTDKSGLRGGIARLE